MVGWGFKGLVSDRPKSIPVTLVREVSYMLPTGEGTVLSVRILRENSNIQKNFAAFNIRGYPYL